MRPSLILSLFIFLIFNGYGVAVQIKDTISKSDSGEIASIFNLGTFFSSPLPIHLAQFITIAIFLSVVFIISQSYFSHVFASRIKRHIHNLLLAKVVWLCIANSVVFILNAAYFQHSNHLTSVFRIWPENHLNIIVCWLILLLPVFYYAWKTIKTKTTQVSLGSILVLCVAFYTTSEPKFSSTEIKTDKPNIIVIGIDSLRSDLFQSQMPFLTSQLKQSTLFESTITPLGRTFPAWNTILSGLYPIHHGARINLIGNENLIPNNQYLPSMLKDHGYRSIFAIDETRFANIGQHQGFQQTITPRMGASDFLISNIADFPLINLLSLSPISRWLLPEIYANRGAAKTYRSDAFSNIIERDLPIADQPTFLSVHFCLAHWPYYFSTPLKPSTNYPEPYYPTNLRAVDQQLISLFMALDEKGYLENSRIVFLSDHGEAWTHESPVFTETNTQEIYRLKEYGHGSSLTSNSNQVLLAFKNFNPALTKNTQKLASLADVTPTILSELNLSTDFNFDGLDLTSSDMPNERFIPVETGTILKVDETNKLNINNIVKDFLNRYQLNETGLLSIKPEKIEDGLKAKGYGLRNRDLILQRGEGNKLNLFNKINSTYTAYENLKSLKDHHPNWGKHWCLYYKSEDPQCN